MDHTAVNKFKNKKQDYDNRDYRVVIMALSFPWGL